MGVSGIEIRARAVGRLVSPRQAPFKSSPSNPPFQISDPAGPGGGLHSGGSERLLPHRV